MKKLLMKYISVILVSFTLVTSTPINASAYFSDVPINAVYADALNRLTSLGIIAEQEKFNPDSLLSREQFAKMIVVAAGLENTAESMKGTTIFPDIAANAWSSGYINVAVNKGYITGWSDGKFHPTQAVTFAQISTILVRALGYTNQDVTGNWPNNYIIKAKELGLTDGITLGSNAGVPRWAAIMMVEKLLDTTMKNSSAATGQTFIEATGSYVKSIVFGDSSTIGSLAKGQVLTDKGIYNNPLNIKLELGSENYLVVKNGNIQKASALSSVLKVSVEQVTENRISYKAGGREESILLPNNITYYYQGQKTDYKSLQTIVQKSASIVFNYNADKTGYSFAVVFDPVYSKPEIAENFVPSSGKLGSIEFGSNPLIIRDGELVNISQIESKDVVYQVTDIWGANKYIQAVDNKVGGKITDILPSRLSPKTIKIGNTSYDLSKSIELSKVTTEAFTIGSSINLTLGYDGKIVDVDYFGTENNSDFAVVLDAGYNITSDSGGPKKINYTAKLLTSDGSTDDYTVTSDATNLKGSLVKFNYTDSNTLSLQQMPVNLSGEVVINKEEDKIGSTYVSDNVKIFNIIFNESGTPVLSSVLKWSDMPSGIIPANKIWYVSYAGPFGDINVILTDDIYNQRYKNGVVRTVNIKPAAGGGNYYEYSILIDGTEYKYNQNISGAAGSVYQFSMSNSGIKSLSQILTPNIKSTRIDAIDSRRIKVNSTIYFFNNNVQIYYMDSNGSITVKSPYELNTSRSYGQISLYMDSNSSGAKVDTIVIFE